MQKAFWSVILTSSLMVAMAYADAPTPPSKPRLSWFKRFLAKYEPFADGGIQLADTYTVTDENSGHTFDVSVDTRVLKASRKFLCEKNVPKDVNHEVWIKNCIEEGSVTGLILPIEARVSVKYDDVSNLDLTDLCIGIIRVAFAQTGLTLQGVSYAQHDFKAPGVGMEREFEIGHAVFKRELNYRDGKWLKFVFKGEAAYGIGRLHKNAARVEARQEQAADGESTLGPETRPESSSYKGGGSAGVLFRDVLYLDLNGSAAYFRDEIKGVQADAKDFNGNSDKLTIQEYRAGSSLRFQPSKYVNLTLSGDLFHYRSHDDIVINRKEYHGKDIQNAKQAMLMLELRY